MFRIFRKIRGDLLFGPRRQTYALYAIGELLLVVVGILIALQVNNWNEERIERRQIERYAIGLVSDLKRDIAMLEPIIEQMQRALERVDALSEYAYGKTLEQIDNFDLWVLAPSFSYRPYEWHRTAMEQMKNAGALRDFRNRALAEKITAYESLTRHLDEDFRSDMARIEAASEFRDSVVDSNYAEEHFTASDRETADQSIEARLAIRREEYTGPRLSPLTSDINDVKIMVNKYKNIGSINSRINTEIPRLKNLAEELIALLADEYSIDYQE